MEFKIYGISYCFKLVKVRKPVLYKGFEVENGC